MVGGLTQIGLNDYLHPPRVLSDRTPAAVGLVYRHGTEDSTFDADNPRMIYAAASGPRDLWILNGVGHTGAYEHNRRAFIDRLEAFFTAGLGSA